MTMTDPIADFLTVIRNANANRSKKVSVPLSKEKVGLAIVLKDEGFVKNYEILGEGIKRRLQVELKYGTEGERVIRKIERESKPGCRVYCPVDEIPKVLNGMGIAILSTPRGILSDRKCRDMSIGGELLCTVY